MMPGAALLLCAQIFYTKAVTNGFEIITSHNDGTTVATVARKQGKDVDHYVGQLATTDSLTEEIAIAKGYVKTEGRCKIGDKTVSILVQHRLINQRS